MLLRRFTKFDEMTSEVCELLEQCLCPSVAETPQVIMLSGGRTPLAAYQRLAERRLATEARLTILLSDERMEPHDSPENNYRNIAPLLASLRASALRTLRVATDRPLGEAVERYDARLRALEAEAPRMALGLLGLGSDGHTASLFTLDDVERGAGRYAIAVPRSPGPDRVSVTRDFLLKFERLVFLAVGSEKAAVAERLICHPGQIAAGAAVAGHPRVELWLSP